MSISEKICGATANLSSKLLRKLTAILLHWAITDSLSLMEFFSQIVSHFLMTGREGLYYVYLGSQGFSFYLMIFLRFLISVTFSWDLLEAERLAEAWSRYGNVQIGGQTTGTRGEAFTPGLYLKHGYTITSRDCHMAGICSIITSSLVLKNISEKFLTFLNTRSTDLNLRAALRLNSLNLGT